MTPFDALALLAILLTFYPVVSVANLNRARAERPEYFAGGTLGGTHGEKLTLPDGRIFDLVFDVDGFSGATRWQVIDVTFGSGGADDPFALVAGPLRPIDLTTWPARTREDVFAPLVAAQLAALDGADDVLGRALAAGAAAGTAIDLEDAWAATLGGAPDVLVDLGRALDAAEPGDIAVVTAFEAELPVLLAETYVEADPGDLPDTGDPGDVPTDGGGGGVEFPTTGATEPTTGATEPTTSEEPTKLPA